MSGKLDGRSYAGTLKNFQSTHIGYRAHRAVIFAIAWHLVYYRPIVVSLHALQYYNSNN